MSSERKAVRDSVLIYLLAIILAGVALMSINRMNISSSHAHDDFFPSLALGVVACLTLFARRLWQAQLALGIYLLIIGVTMIILPRVQLANFGENDFDALVLIIGPWYLLVGCFLLLVSLIVHRHELKNERMALIQPLLLAGPGTILMVVFLFVFGSNEWRMNPYGFQIIVASWIIGIGIFLAGSRFAQINTPRETSDLPSKTK